MTDETLQIRRVRLCHCGRRAGHHGDHLPSRRGPRATGPARNVLAAIAHAQQLLELDPDLYHDRRRAGDNVQALLAHQPRPAGHPRADRIATPLETRREIRQVLLELELTSNGATQAWNPSGGPTGEPDDRFVAQVATRIQQPTYARDLDVPHLLYRRQFDRATSLDEIHAILDVAYAELEHLRRRRTPATTGMTDGELLEHRILTEGDGWAADRVAQALRCTPRLVQQTRRRNSRDPDTGKPIALPSNDGDVRERARQLIDQGMTERQVTAITGLPKTTIRRVCGKAA